MGHKMGASPHLVTTKRLGASLPPPRARAGRRFPGRGMSGAAAKKPDISDDSPDFGRLITHVTLKSSEVAQLVQEADNRGGQPGRIAGADNRGDNRADNMHGRGRDTPTRRTPNERTTHRAQPTH